MPQCCLLWTSVFVSCSVVPVATEVALGASGTVLQAFRRFNRQTFIEGSCNPAGKTVWPQGATTCGTVQHISWIQRKTVMHQAPTHTRHCACTLSYEPVSESSAEARIVFQLSTTAGIRHTPACLSRACTERIAITRMQACI